MWGNENLVLILDRKCRYKGTFLSKVIFFYRPHSYKKINFEKNCSFGWLLIITNIKNMNFQNFMLTFSTSKLDERCFFSNFGGHKSFCEAPHTPVFDFWWYLLWVSKPEWTALFALGRGVHVTHSLNMIAKAFSSTFLQAGIGGTRNQDLFYCYCLTVWGQADTRLTSGMPARLMKGVYHS